jgi:hypothetical protein
MTKKILTIVTIILFVYLAVILISDIIEENRPDVEKAIAHNINERPVYECWWE